MTLLTERYHKKIAGVLSCFDRVVITGSLGMLSFAQGITHYLSTHKIRIFVPISMFL